MAVVLTNNAETTLAAGISAVATSLTVAVGQGALFPNPGASDWFPLLLIKADGSAYEIVRGTNRAGDGISIERARESTTAIAFVAGDIVSHRVTAEALISLASTSSTDVPASVSGGVNSYVVSLPDVSAYADGLRVAFRAHVQNTGAITLKVNSLADIDVTDEAGNPMVATDVATGQFVECVYDSASGDFIIDNIRYPSSSTAEPGYAQRGTDEDFDINGDNASFVTQRNASRIADEAVTAALAALSQTQIPTAYANKGNAAGGNNTISAATSFAVNRELQYADLTIAATGVINFQGLGVAVVRCTGKFLVEAGGTLNLPRSHNVGFRQHYGPTGGEVPPSIGTVSVPRGEYPNGTSVLGDSIDLPNFQGAVLNGEPLHFWHGGHGVAHIASYQTIAPGGGLIIVANEVEFEAGANINGMNALPGAGFQASSAGGVLLVSANSFVHPVGADYEAGSAGNFQDETYWQNAVNDNEVADAGNGQLLLINLSTAAFSVIF